MAILGHDFNAADHNALDPDKIIEAIPGNGYVVAKIVESEIKPTKDQQGRYLELVFEVAAGDHAGARLWMRLNLWNKSQKAMKIAGGQLSAICEAIGVAKVNDTAVLHDKPMLVKITYEPPRQVMENGQVRVFKARNEVKGASKTPWDGSTVPELQMVEPQPDGAAPGVASPAPAPAPVGAPATPPWGGGK